MNGTGKKAMAARQAPQCKAKDNDGMEGLVSSIKQLDLSEGFFSHEVVKGYPVGTLIWTDKTSLQKYVEFQIIVPLCTNAADLHQIPVLADGGKQVQVWICKEPKAAEYNPMVFPGISLTNMPLKPKVMTLTPRSPGTQRLRRSANVRQEQERHVSCL